MNEKILKNPISNIIKQSIDRCEKRLNIAVPFLSSFIRTIFKDKNLNEIEEKRLITRFDETSINSFDIPTLKYLLEGGFDIQFDNSIHLKLYVADDNVFVSSSNFTKGGFENNIELTVKIDSDNISDCINLFNEIWGNTGLNKVTKELLDNNLAKYEFLKKREKFRNNNQAKLNSNQLKIVSLDIHLLIDEIFRQKNDYSRILSLSYEANKIREKTKSKLLHGFDTEIFYVSEGHPKRRDNLFYDFAYGYEVDLAGTGLRELQFKSTFEHPDFVNVISYIFPEMVGMEPWNLDDRKIYYEFCNGIFDFDISQYTEALPIRLASYFHPEYFLPIFKLEHLQKVCESFGLETDAKTKGERLFTYNTYIADKMKAIPYNNYIKSNISYHILYTVELYKRLYNGEDYENIKMDYKEVWKKELIEEGKKVLIKLNAIK